MYITSVTKNYLDSFTWLERKNKKPERKWSLKEYAEIFSHDNCLEISKQYKTVREFMKSNSTCYKKCIRKRWIDECVWLVDDRIVPIFSNPAIDYDYCYELAKHYGSKTEFSNEHRNIYEKAKKNGWVDDYTWFKGLNRLKDKNFCVYSYESYVHKMAYVGLTNDIKRRHRQHENKVPKKDYYDRVKEYFISVGESLPMYKMLESGLTADEAQFYENFWVKQYENNGWSLLNKAKTGKGTSSLGAFVNKWTHDVCVDIAKKYTTIKDFSSKDNNAYQACCRNGWLTELTWLKNQSRRYGIKVAEVDDAGDIVKVFNSFVEVKKTYGFDRKKIKNMIQTKKMLENGHFLKEL